jgi:hypothetical protein
MSQSMAEPNGSANSDCNSRRCGGAETAFRRGGLAVQGLTKMSANSYTILLNVISHVLGCLDKDTHTGTHHCMRIPTAEGRDVWACEHSSTDGCAHAHIPEITTDESHRVREGRPSGPNQPFQILASANTLTPGAYLATYIAIDRESSREIYGPMSCGLVRVRNCGV